LVKGFSQNGGYLTRFARSVTPSFVEAEGERVPSEPGSLFGEAFLEKASFTPWRPLLTISFGYFNW